ncbi:unnamed protein product [Clonostachys rhizophaga]|uniref:Saccharopine dehydrogenase NADP binding domain-containing protein n=1 Tax=Clonostachys rhizophaga TaxID=160324 RepID=A0A9N9YK52_9HYPO|nr:unnamed protein product [Clonostachys rhizophaga]
MSLNKHDRQYDLVVFGATGYTGKHTAEFITKNLPTNLKWAVAGRSQPKLQAVVDACRELVADREQPAIEIADVTDEASIVALAKKTFIVISTAGPYSKYGETVFKACAENGTHYVDCTGEFPWVGNMITKYEKVAKASGALMFPQTGLESAPADLCSWAMAKCLRENLNAQTGRVIMSIHTLRSSASGGTIASVLNVFETFSLKELQAATKPYACSPVPREGQGRFQPGIMARIFGSRNIPDLGTVTTSPAGSTDAFIVERTWGLLSATPSRKAEFYGPNFTFEEYLRVRNWIQGVALHFFLTLGPALLLLSSFARSLLRRVTHQPGQGSDRASATREEVEYRGTAEPDAKSGSGQKAFCRVRHFGGPYALSGLLMAQVALTLLEEDVQLDGGIYTSACLGQGLIDRAAKAGFKIETEIIS